MRWIGAIFLLTGAILTPTYIARMLELPFFLAMGGATNFYLWYYTISALLYLGPSLLMLSGMSTLASTAHKHWWVLGGAAGLLGLLSGFAYFDMKGAELSPVMLVTGVGIALALAFLLTLIVKRAWIGALIGAFLAVPLFLNALQFIRMDLAYFGFGHLTFGIFPSADIAAVILWPATVLCALRLRTKTAKG